MSAPWPAPGDELAVQGWMMRVVMVHPEYPDGIGVELYQYAQEVTWGRRVVAGVRMSPERWAQLKEEEEEPKCR